MSCARSNHRLAWTRSTTAVVAVLAFSWLLNLALPAATSAQSPAAQRLYEEAERLRTRGDASAALDEYLLVVQQFPSDRLAAQALLHIVRLRRSSADDHGAGIALAKLLDEYARTPEAASGFLLEAAIRVADARESADLEAARATVRRIPLLYGSDEYPTLDARTRARIRSGELGLILGDLQGAAADFLAAIEDDPPSPWTGRARLRLGTTLIELGDIAAGLEVLQRLVDETTDEAAGDGAAIDRAEARTSVASDRARARSALALAHRHLIRPAAGEPHWQSVERYPTGASLRSPNGVAAAFDGRLLVTDDQENRVLLLDVVGAVLANREVKQPGRPGFTDDDTAFVLDGNDVLLPFDRRNISFLQPKGGREAPLKGMLAAVRGPFADWFIVAKSEKGLLNYQSPRVGQELFSSLRLDLVDLDRGEYGRVYALDRKGKKVVRLGLDRRSINTVVQGSDWKRPQALAVDRLGNIYVLDRGSRQVTMYDANGRQLTRVGPTLLGGIELRSPEDIAVDAKGRLLIADSKLPFLIVLD